MIIYQAEEAAEKTIFTNQELVTSFSTKGNTCIVVRFENNSWKAAVEWLPAKMHGTFMSAQYRKPTMLSIKTTRFWACQHAPQNYHMKHKIMFVCFVWSCRLHRNNIKLCRSNPGPTNLKNRHFSPIFNSSQKAVQIQAQDYQINKNHHFNTWSQAPQ